MAINMYAYSYKSALKEFLDSGFMLIKVGDSHREVEIRMSEQGGAAEWEGKIKMGKWDNLQKIDRDYRIHEILTKRGLHHKGGSGTEWFKIPATTQEEAFEYLDNIITDLEGRKVRSSVKLRALQQKALDKAMAYIDAGGTDVSIIANLCPRFGKTIWALSLFNAISEKYGNRVMLVPAYWLSAHSSFSNELKKEYNEFLDIVEVTPNDSDSADKASTLLKEGKRLLVPISLHGDVPEWQLKHNWISNINNDDIFMFADEGDFGTHTENQIEKLAYLFNE